jgi:hypothetical protein
MYRDQSWLCCTMLWEDSREYSWCVAVSSLPAIIEFHD